MANVSIKFNNKDYLLSCDDGQEESLKKLTKFLDKKYSDLQDKLGNIGENKLLLITTIQLIDEYFDLKQKVTNQKIKLDEISSDINVQDFSTKAVEIGNEALNGKDGPAKDTLIYTGALSLSIIRNIDFNEAASKIKNTIDSGKAKEFFYNAV